MSEESSGTDPMWARHFEIHREEWEMLVERARARGYAGVMLRSYVAGLVDALDSDRGVSILEAITGHTVDDWRAALEELLLHELSATGGLIVWCVVRVSPGGRVRELRNLHASADLAKQYVAKHPLPEGKGTLEIEDWLVASGFLRQNPGEPIIPGDFDSRPKKPTEPMYKMLARRENLEAQGDFDAALRQAGQDFARSGAADLSEEELIALAKREQRDFRRERRTALLRRLAAGLRIMLQPWGSADPEIHSGDLCFSGTRVPVSTLWDALDAGRTPEDFLDGYPSVRPWQVVAAIRERPLHPRSYDP